MHRRILLLLALLSGCSSPSDDATAARESSGAVAADEVRPSFAVPADVAISQLERIVEFGTSIGSMSSPDTYSGGETITSNYPGGSIHIFTLANGRIWRARILAGVGEQCGTIAQPARAAELMTAVLLSDPSTALDAGTSRGISDAIARDAIFTADLAGARITASGSCVDALTLTAV